MSFDVVKGYFRSRMSALGFTKEHPKPFDTDEIASTLRDKTFHILLANFNGVSNNQNHQVMTIEVGMQMFFKGYRNEEDGRQLAVETLDSIIKECCTAVNRVTQASDGIKNVSFLFAETVPVEDSNDNITLLNMAFEVLYTLDFE